MAVTCAACGARVTGRGYMPDEYRGGSHYVDYGRALCEECGEDTMQEFRVCAGCGEPVTEVMTDLEGLDTCEGCFAQVMDGVYGRGAWRANADGLEGEDGGSYEHLEGGRWLDTGMRFLQL